MKFYTKYFVLKNIQNQEKKRGRDLKPAPKFKKKKKSRMDKVQFFLCIVPWNPFRTFKNFSKRFFHNRISSLSNFGKVSFILQFT